MTRKVNVTRIGLEKEEREKEKAFPQKDFPSRIWLLHKRLLCDCLEAAGVPFDKLGQWPVWAFERNIDKTTVILE